MKFTDHYATLGVPVDATQEQIKKAYRNLARKFHPDVNKAAGAEKRFTDISAAYDELQDPVRRLAHDRLRNGGWKVGQEMDAPTVERGSRQGPVGGGGDAGFFADYLRSVFEGQGRMEEDAGTAFHERGGDVQYDFHVTLEEAFHGGERQFTIVDPTSAGGRAADRGTRTISVKIPPGVVQGTRIRLRGQGHSGSQPGMPGDLLLLVGFMPHDRYHIQGGDVLLEVPIAPWEAALGANIEVPTLGGVVTATIPVDAQNGQRLRLKGRGLPTTPPGDQYLTLRIVMPPVASEDDRIAYRSLAAHSTFNPRPQFVA